MILYEYPFNERIRTYLRLEHLFQRLGELMAGESPLQHHYALVTLFEVMDVAARADLKADVLRDLDKHKATFVSYRGNPAIQEGALEQVIARLDRGFAALNGMAGKAGQTLTDNEWLMAIRSRASIPAGTCGFDLPGYYAWQHYPVSRRRQDIERWTATLAPLAEGVQLLLQLLRDTDVPYRVVAPGGQFQQTLPQGRSFQLLRLRIDPATGLVPEISGNRLMVSVRLMREDADGRLQSSHEDAAFELTLCS
ncbi:MAG: cell division protein ZapD [Comamonadaceae bacterium]|nr:MAG: cell division protein ZapD [Comamonadaceae bacterium]